MKVGKLNRFIELYVFCFTIKSCPVSPYVSPHGCLEVTGVVEVNYEHDYLSANSYCPARACLSILTFRNTDSSRCEGGGEGCAGVCASSVTGQCGSGGGGGGRGRGGRDF